MHFTIITPSFNQLDYLKRCIASVRDQVAPEVQRSEISSQRSDSSTPSTINHELPTALSVHHHVQDGGSVDGAVDWLREIADAMSSSRNQQTGSTHYKLSFASEADSGMYDALNRGIDAVSASSKHKEPSTKGRISPNPQQPTTNNSRDSVMAWLNCDEQYLPGTLEKVTRYFKEHPEVDFVYGNALLLDESGALLTFRKNPPLRKNYVQSDHLYTQSCAIFFRDKIFRSGNRFDTRWKAVSDCEFIVNLLTQGFKGGRIDDYLSAFFMTGSNLSGSGEGMDELKRWRASMPSVVRALHFPLRIFRYIEKGLVGGYREKFPLAYSIFMPSDLNCREVLRAEKGTSRFVSWKR